MKKRLKRLIGFVVWLWTPECEPEAEPEPPVDEPPIEDIPQEDELSLIQLEITDLKNRLKASRIRREQVEKNLMGQRSDDLMEKLLVFADEVKHGDASRKFREVKESIELLKIIGSNWLEYFNKHLERRPEMNDRSERAFYVNFTEQMSKPDRDFGDAMTYIAKRRKKYNPFTIYGKF